MDGLSVLYALSPAINAELYKQGNAHGWLAKSSAAVVSHHLAGRLYMAKSGWLLLSVPNALVRGVFDAMTAAGVELPRAGVMNVPNVDKELLNAHISVMTVEEAEKIGAGNINERGHSFRYSLGPVKEITPNNIDGVSKIWAIQVSSPDLSALRKSYGLSPLPKDEPFHITVAVRRTNVLRDNDISKCYETSAETTDGHSFRNPISRGVTKAAEEMPQPRVRIVLPYKGKYLLETLNNPKWPQNIGKRRFIGGGIEGDETPEQTAAREMFEELGVKIKPTAFRALGPDPNKPHEHYLELAKHKLKPGNFKATVGSDPIITLAHGAPTGDDYIGPDIQKLLAPIIQKAAALSRSGHTDLLPGVKADNVPDRDFSPEDFAIGAADEHAHTNNDQIPSEIAADYLQEDPRQYEKEKLIQKDQQPAIILKLREAKEHSDNKRYDKKNEILRNLMTQAPNEWFVDDPLPRHMGITHAPTSFRFHADPGIIPTGVKVKAKAASSNPYWDQITNFSQAPVIDKSKSIWQNFFSRLKDVAGNADRQFDMQQNDHKWRAELIPGYREQMNTAIARGEFPKPNPTAAFLRNTATPALAAVT